MWVLGSYYTAVSSKTVISILPTTIFRLYTFKVIFCKLQESLTHVSVTVFSIDHIKC